MKTDKYLDSLIKLIRYPSSNVNICRAVNMSYTQQHNNQVAMEYCALINCTDCSFNCVGGGVATIEAINDNR